MPTLPPIASLAVAGATPSVRKTDAPVPARPERRAEQVRKDTQVRLTDSGRLQGSLAQLESAGRAAADSQRVVTNKDVRQNVQNVVDAYNEVDRSLATAVRREERRPAVPDSSADFRRVGINADPNGTLNLDARALERALQSDPNGAREAVARIGRQAEQTAGEQLGLAGGGRPDNNSLDGRPRTPESLQQDQQARTAAAQQTATARSEAARFSVAGGLASYQRIFSL